MAGGRQARRASAETIPGSPRKRALPVPGDDVEYRACQRREHARRARFLRLFPCPRRIGASCCIAYYRRVGNRGADLPQQLAAGRRPQPQATISIAKGCKRDGDACDRGGSADCASSGLAVRAGARSLALCRLAGFRHRAGKHGIAKHGGGAPARARPPDLYSRGNDGGGALRIDYVRKNSCTRARAHARNATISDPRPLSLTDPDKCRRAEWQSCRKSSGAAHRNARSSDSSEPRVPMVPLSHALRNVRASGAWAEVCLRPDLPPLDAC